jgi:hypothetical protein
MISFLFLLACVTKHITGSVLTPDGNPLERATVELLGQTTQTDASGNFTFDGMAVHKGQYDILCTHTEYSFYRASYDIMGRTYVVPTVQLAPLDITIPYMKMSLDPKFTE